jgi:DNA replication protein DnaC/putative replication protein
MAEKAERKGMTQEELDRLFPIRIEKNTCAKCGAEYDQPALVTQFGVIVARCCPTCVDKYDAAENSKIKHIKDNNKELWLEEIGIKEQYKKATLENYKPQTESQNEALTACKLVDSGELNKLVLLGGNGVGKTHLASALVKKHNGLLITAYEMFATYRGCFSGKTSEIEVIKKFSKIPLLAIDEYGRTKGSEAEENFMSAIIDNRHSNNLPTIILSNLIRKRDCVFYTADNKVCANCQRNNCLESRLTKDVISRLRENSRVILVEGEDYRRRAKENAR